MPNDLLYFISKWEASRLSERAAYQQHFRDLCEVLGVRHPTFDDEIGANYTFEKRVTKVGSSETGFADVWKRGFFAWEYKAKGGDLEKAYRQLNEYHESLNNPPLLVVSDMARFEVHTKFENQPPRVYSFTLEDLKSTRDTATCALPPLDVLRFVFTDPNQLRPGLSAERVTRAAASDFLKLAQRLEIERSLSPEPPTKEEIAHFLMRLVFCLFADSVSLLPDHTFRRLVTSNRHSPIAFNRILPTLFQAMSEPDGIFGPAPIPYFNGGLFTDNRIIPLDHADLGILKSAADHDWSHVEPSIFGTLFERSLDSAKRSMIGAHYTSPDDILLLIEPVVVAPLRRRWESVQADILTALAAEPPLGKDGKLAASLRANRPALTLLQQWAAELSHVRVLDPACGSGNFLYLALKRLLDLWQEARQFGIDHGLTVALEPTPSPAQLFGIEIDFYAHEIASVVVWIGFLQWRRDHGILEERSPVLQRLPNIERADAILRYDAEGKPYEPIWPEAEYIIGNPPFLGDKIMRSELDSLEHPDYVDCLRTLYRFRVPGGADLVTYWFDKSRRYVELGSVKRVGLIGTQGIRNGANRLVLKRILANGSIFFAFSDHDWVLEGAMVHVSLIAFDDGSEKVRFLDGNQVRDIHPDLTAGTDFTHVRKLNENAGLCFVGTQKGGSFDIDLNTAKTLLKAPLNPNGRSNADVVKVWTNALSIMSRTSQRYIIDFGTKMPEHDAALYEMPFAIVEHRVKPFREQVRRSNHRKRWWLFAESRPGMRKAIATHNRYIATPMVAKHRVFTWQPSTTIPENLLVVIAKSDDYMFGVLQSGIHEVWSRRMGSQLREASSAQRYAPESTFLTFPFPYRPGTEPCEADSPIVRRIADAARELVRLRDAWLNPPGIPEEDLKKRTLTNLYNQRPTWLANAHRTLDEAVFAAYGWPPDLTKDQILAHLLALNHQRAAAQPAPKAAKAASGRRKPASAASGEQDASAEA